MKVEHLALVPFRFPRTPTRLGRAAVRAAGEFDPHAGGADSRLGVEADIAATLR